MLLCLEVIIEIVSLGLRRYSEKNLNKLDLAIMLTHISSYIVETSADENVFNPRDQLYISVRCMKILRTFKLLNNFSLFGNMKVYIQTYY